jgi:hypothetical protein
MRCSDGHLYVVKFQSNPQHRRVLVNEMVVTRIAHLLGLPVPSAQVVEVSGRLIQHSPEMTIQLGRHTQPLDAGRHFGSRHLLPSCEGPMLDWIPESLIPLVRNLATFAGMLALDKWTCNCDKRQAIFWKRARERRYTAYYVDHGYCFNAGDWTFPDSPLRGAYPWNEVYEGVRGWESFEPWLSGIEQMDPSMIHACADGVPPEWYSGDSNAMSKMLETLVDRRKRVRELIFEFRNSSRKPFPNWISNARRSYYLPLPFGAIV